MLREEMLTLQNNILLIMNYDCIKEWSGIVLKYIMAINFKYVNPLDSYKEKHTANLTISNFYLKIEVKKS